MKDIKRQNPPKQPVHPAAALTGETRVSAALKPNYNTAFLLSLWECVCKCAHTCKKHRLQRPSVCDVTETTLGSLDKVVSASLNPPVLVYKSSRSMSVSVRAVSRFVALISCCGVSEVNVVHAAHTHTDTLRMEAEQVMFLFIHIPNFLLWSITSSLTLYYVIYLFKDLLQHLSVPALFE